MRKPRFKRTSFSKFRKASKWQSWDSNPGHLFQRTCSSTWNLWVAKIFTEQEKKTDLDVFISKEMFFFFLVSPFLSSFKAKCSKANSLFSHLREQGGSFLLWQSKWRRKRVWFHHWCFRGVYCTLSCLPSGSSDSGRLGRICCLRSWRFNSLPSLTIVGWGPGCVTPAHPVLILQSQGSSLPSSPSKSGRTQTLTTFVSESIETAAHDPTTFQGESTTFLCFGCWLPDFMYI